MPLTLRNAAIRWSVCALLATALWPTSAFACAACFGASDSKLAVGMNWGILSLLVVVVGVLVAFAAFFVYLAKRSAAFPASAGSDATTGIPKN